MQILRSNSQALLLLVALCLGAASGFQISASTAIQNRVRGPTVLHLNQFPIDDDEYSSPFGDSTGEPPLPTTGIPKLKIPTPSFTMPEIDFKEILIKAAILGGTVLVFLAIQKGGLLLSEMYTPELSAEQVRDFRL